jgi:hypothetical protein
MKFLASAVVLRFTKTAVCHPWTNGSFSCDGFGGPGRVSEGPKVATPRNTTRELGSARRAQCNCDIWGISFLDVRCGERAFS